MPQTSFASHQIKNYLTHHSQSLSKVLKTVKLTQQKSIDTMTKNERVWSPGTMSSLETDLGLLIQPTPIIGRLIKVQSGSGQ